MKSAFFPPQASPVVSVTVAINKTNWGKHSGSKGVRKHMNVQRVNAVWQEWELQDVMSCYSKYRIAHNSQSMSMIEDVQWREKKGACCWLMTVFNSQCLNQLHYIIPVFPLQCAAVVHVCFQRPPADKWPFQRSFLKWAILPVIRFLKKDLKRKCRFLPRNVRVAAVSKVKMEFWCLSNKDKIASTLPSGQRLNWTLCVCVQVIILHLAPSRHLS